MPVKNNTYEIYIAQGQRTYRQKTGNLVIGSTNTVPLTTPFVIDGTQQLIVAIHASNLSGRESEYPAVCDGGPAVQGKGNIYSYDAQTWETLYDENDPDDEFDLNFFIAAIVTSTERDLPVTPYSGEQPEAVVRTSGSAASVRMASSSSLLPQRVSLYSLQPNAFPTVTGYNIYRNRTKIATVSPSPTRYVDANPQFANSYQVSAMFGAYEGSLSAPSIAEGNAEVDETAIAIYPVLFGSQVEIKGFERVTRVEVYAADGRCCLKVEHPDKWIHTQSLPAGVYFFRLYTDNAAPEVLRGIKKSW
jgi:hypothetical protein